MLAIVEATGSPDPSRSHFDAQDYMESGTPGMKRDGWLNRALPPATPDSSPLRAIALSATLPRTLQGDREAIAINDVQQFHAAENTASIVESMYANSADKRLAAAGKDAFAAMQHARLAQPHALQPIQRRAVRAGRGTGPQPATNRAPHQSRCRRRSGVRRDRRLGPSPERAGSIVQRAAPVRRRAIGFLHRYGRSHGGYCPGDDVRVRPHRAARTATMAPTMAMAMRCS